LLTLRTHLFKKNRFLAQPAELIVQPGKNCLCVCVLTRVAQIMTAASRDL